MHIDWTQTLLGAEGQFAQEDSGTEGRRLRIGSIVLAGRMAGMLGAVLVLAGLIATLPFLHHPGARIEELSAIVGLLVLQVLAFALARRDLQRTVPVLSVLLVVSALFLFGMGMSFDVVCASTLLLLAEVAAIHFLGRDRRRAAAIVLGMGLSAAAIGLFLALPNVIAAALMAALATPSLAMLPVILAPGTRLAPEQVAGVSSLRALLDVTLSRFPGPVLVVNGVGGIEPASEGASFGEHLRAGAIASGSLSEELLVVDRPVLLQALSRAIHDQVPSENVMVRMRHEQARGIAYRPRSLSIWPVAGLPGRALVLIAPGEEARPPRKDNETDHALLQRAMHDAVSPFNAGLGYLELIADPRLAPRDLASTRHYAREARAALMEAHRNTALISRWLRLSASPPAGPRERSDLFRAATDAARMFACSEGEESEILVLEPECSVHAEISGEALRFAIGALLRSVVKGGGMVEVSIHANGGDATLTARMRDGASLPAMSDDVFQMALQQAAEKFGRLGFSERNGERRLTLSGAAILPMQPLTSGDMEPISRGRLAS